MATNDSESKVEFKQLLGTIHPVEAATVRSRVLRDYVEVRQNFFDYPVYLEWRKGRSWILCCHGGPRCGKTCFAAAVAERLIKPDPIVEDRDGKEYNHDEYDDDEEREEADNDGVQEEEEVEAANRDEEKMEQATHDDEHQHDVHQDPEQTEILDSTTDDEEAVDADEEQAKDGITQDETSGRIVISVFLGHGSDQSISNPTVNLLRAILRQLLEYSKHELALPSTDNAETWRELVKAEMVQYPDIYLIVDGLDWVLDPSDYSEIRTEITNLQHLVDTCSTRIMLVQSPTETMEPENLGKGCTECELRPDTYWRCQDCSYWVCQDCYDAEKRCDPDHLFSEPYATREISIDPSYDDIQHYVDTVFDQARTDERFEAFLQNQDVINDVEGSIVGKSNESFLIARMYVDTIIRTRSLEVLEVSDRILPAQLEYYNSLMHEVLSSPDWELALRILSLVATASDIEQPMTFQELRDALPGIDLTMADLLRSTKHFVGIYWNDVTKVPLVKPFHVTAGTYLKEECQKIQDHGLDLSELCLENVNEDHAFSDYAIRHWPLLRQDSKNLDDWDKPEFRSKTFLALNDQAEVEYFSGSDIMHVAAWHGLADVDGDVNVRDVATGETPLHIAVRRDKLDHVKQLLEQGADHRIEDNSGKTALWLAIERERSEMTELLLKKTHNTDIQDMTLLLSRNLDSKLTLLQKWRGDLKALDRHDRTLLFYADDENIVDHLIAKGVDINHEDKYGLSAVHVSEIPDILKEKGATEKELDFSKLYGADVPIEEALQDEHFDVLEKLDPDLIIYHQQTPFELALNRWPMNVAADSAMSMFDRTRRVSQTHLQGLLKMAIEESDSTEYVTRLVERGADLFTWSDVGLRPSAMAEKMCVSAEMQILIKRLEEERIKTAMIV